jgi:predicted nucleotidyltransferase
VLPYTYLSQRKPIKMDSQLCHAPNLENYSVVAFESPPRDLRPLIKVDTRFNRIVKHRLLP